MKTIIFPAFFACSVLLNKAYTQDCILPTPPIAGNQCTFNVVSGDDTHVLTVPAGYVVSVTVQAWGAGGGAGQNTNRAGGGGGGGYASKNNINLFEGTHTIKVGKGGTPGTGGTGNTGGASELLGGNIIANGGAGSVETVGGVGGGGMGNIVFIGGNGANVPNNNDGGGGGGGAGSTSNGMAGSGSTGGAGGSGGGGAGGNGGNNGQGGNNGLSLGGGGGGKGNGSNGTSGTGADGRVIITVNSVALALPIELVQFIGKVENTSVLLTWETASEFNNEKFVIEQSLNGKDFIVIGEIQGSGTTQQRQSYQFLHTHPSPGPNYYRLKQVDYDGQFAYSPVVVVEMLREEGVAIVPTVVQGELTIRTTEDGPYMVTLFDLRGALVLRQASLMHGRQVLDVSDLQPGYYLAVVETGGKTFRERVLKL